MICVIQHRLALYSVFVSMLGIVRYTAWAALYSVIYVVQHRVVCIVHKMCIVYYTPFSYVIDRLNSMRLVNGCPRNG